MIREQTKPALSDPRHPLPRRHGATPAVIGLIAVCTTVELVLQGADHRLWGSVLWRGMAYQYGGFWPGLLHDWQPNFRFQAVLMFGTHGFLHAGLGHLVGNMVTLAVLAQRMPRRVTTTGFLALYAMSMLGGAAGFALLPHGASPVVGASGAIFGVAGALTWQDVTQRQHGGGRRLALILAGLIVLNLVTWALQGGNLAWQAHLGGFLTGFAAMAAYPRLLAKIRS